MILKDNGLKVYDPMKLLLLSDGRCAQDDCFIVPVGEEELPLKIEDFEQFTKYRTLDTTMLAARMHCSRQYIKQLTDKGSLHPLRAGSNHVLYPAREAEAG